MRLPFTVDQFFEVFGRYNLAIWPAQIIAYVLGLGAVILALARIPLRDRLISAILGLFWLWMGVVYHILFFSPINPAARLFGILFVLQGILFLAFGVFTDRLRFGFSSNFRSVTGLVFLLYAMIVYHLLGSVFGHVYPQIPVFGVAPCPTTIFTFGMLLLAKKPVPIPILIIPFLWSLVGMSAAVHLRVPQDFGLLVAGVMGTALVLLQRAREG
jgi:hypothetical protein